MMSLMHWARQHARRYDVTVAIDPHQHPEGIVRAVTITVSSQA